MSSVINFMPTNKLTEFINRLKSLETKMDADRVGIQIAIAELHTNVGWLTKAFWVIATACVTATGSIVVGLIKYFLHKV